MDYLENKKRANLYFTYHNIDPSAPYISMKNSHERISVDAGPSWWSHLSGRYRSRLEQKEFIERGCVDVKLGRIREENDPADS